VAKPTTAVLAGLTKAELQTKLDVAKVKYSSRQTKAQLIALLT
jgi:hypothetical protein